MILCLFSCLRVPECNFGDVSCNVSTQIAIYDILTNNPVTIRLSATGQAACYAYDSGIPDWVSGPACSDSSYTVGATDFPYGQDGHYTQLHAPISLSEYTPDIIYDANTGLYWQRCPKGMSWNGATCSGTAAPATYADAEAYCAGLPESPAELPWRVPTLPELVSIFDYSSKSNTGDPLLNPSVFTGLTASYLRTSSDYSATARYIAILSSGQSYNGFFNDSDPIDTVCVSGNPLPPASYTDNGDGTVYDSTWNLTWMQCGLDAAGDPLDFTTDCIGTLGTHTYFDAARFCEQSSFAGRTEWRFPNARELQTLVDYTQAAPPFINQAMFPNTPTGSTDFISSTTDGGNISQVHSILFDNGGSADYRTATKGAPASPIGDYVRCVAVGN